MSESEKTSRRLTVAVGRQTPVSRPCGLQTGLVSDVETDGSVSAPFTGQAVFAPPVVMPKTADVTGCRVTVTANAPATVRVGSVSETIDAGRQRELALPPTVFAQGTQFEIEELGFSDFVQFDLTVTVDAAPDEHAKLKLEAHVDYLLPVESAAAYLNYIMTQA